MDSSIVKNETKEEPLVLDSLEESDDDFDNEYFDDPRSFKQRGKKLHKMKKVLDRR